MKIRSGFVSNSSSSSYILTLADEKDCEHCGNSNAKMLSLIVSLFSDPRGKNDAPTSLPSSYIGEPEHFIEMLEHELSEIDYDIGWMTEKIKYLERISKNRVAISLLEEWSEIHKSMPSRYQRRNEESIENPEEKMRERIEWLARDISRAKNDKIKLKEKIEKIKAANCAGKELYSFDLSYHEIAHSVVKNLINSGFVEVIEEINT